MIGLVDILFFLCLYHSGYRTEIQNDRNTERCPFHVTTSRSYRYEQTTSKTKFTRLVVGIKDLQGSFPLMGFPSKYFNTLKGKDKELSP